MFVFFNDIDGTISSYTFKSKWIQSDMNVHTIDVIFNQEFDNTQYNCYIQFLREGETKPSPKLPMTPEIITYGEGTYRGYTFKATTEWYTAIAGTLKASIEIKQYEETGLETNKAYGIVNIPIEQSLSDSPEVESTLTTEEYDSFMAVINAKLNIDDEKVKHIETTFNTENDFAIEVLKKTEEIGKPRLFLATIATSAANKRNVVGICQKASSGNYVLILDGNGSIKVSNGLTLIPVKFSNLEANLFSFTNGSIANLTITTTLNATNASVTVATPSSSSNPTTKKYVDDIKTELQDKINGIEAAQNLLDIVKDYQELDEYENKHLLKVDDKIKVLEDENYGNAGTYYKWTGTAWRYIGKDGNYYTQTEVDNKINVLKAQIDSLITLINTLTSSNVSYKED